MNIQKRDGRIMPFDKTKIENAVLKAFDAVDTVDDYAKEKAENIADYIENKAKDSGKTFTVEEIQDLVESGLMSIKRKDVAKAYILYREKRSRIRQGNTSLMKVIEEKINASDIQNQNANVDEQSFGGRMGEAKSELMRYYALNYLVSDMAKNNHINNEIYIHDLDSYAVGMHNCLSIPFDDLLAKGFNTRQTDVRPAQSINTAFQLLAVIFQLQSLQQFGGVSATHLDWTMVPYVRKSFYKHYNELAEFIGADLIENEDATNLSIDDEIYLKNDKLYNGALKATEKELNQAVEGMYHNLSY